MQWYKHESNAHSDAKLVRVIMKYGLQGYGLYFYILELIMADFSIDNTRFGLEHDAEVISHHTGTDKERIEEIIAYMVSLKLFERSDGKITCMKMAKRFDQSMTSNPKMREIITKIRGGSNNNHDSVMTKSCKNRVDENRTDKKRLDKKYTSNSPSANSTSLHNKEVKQDIKTIFSSWQTVMNHPRAKFDDKRRAVIEDALKTYSVDDLLKAIRGCAATPYNMGQNESGVVYDGLDLILRDAEHIERFIRHYDSPPNSKNKKQAEQDTLKDQIYNNMEAAR